MSIKVQNTPNRAAFDVQSSADIRAQFKKDPQQVLQAAAQQFEAMFPKASSASPMRSVATWQAPILMTRTLERTQEVGYGATVRVAKGTRIATVASGYADGYLRHASNRAVGYVGTHRVPLLGRVTMDMLCFDVSTVPESLLGEGMPLTLLGDQPGIRVDDLAAAAGTIGYEVLTRIGARVGRIHGSVDKVEL